MKYPEVIYNPDSFFRNALEEGMSYKPSIVVIILTILISTASTIPFAEVYARATVEAISTQISSDQTEVVYAMTYYLTILSPLFTIPILWIVISAVLHGISALFGGKGEFSTTLKFTAFSYVPVIVLSPLSFIVGMEIASIIAAEGVQGLMSETVKIAQASTGTLTTLWQMTLWTFAIKYARSLPTKKALYVALIPGAVFLIGIWLSLILPT
jgi:hypothetical protein